MIKTEFYKTREDGVVLSRTYSDKGMCIERDGILYADAVDPEGSNREYIESNIPVYDGEATEEDYLSALEKLGVSE